MASYNGKLLDEATDNIVGDGFLFTVPVTIFVDGNLDSGNVSIAIAADINGTPGPYAEALNFTAEGRKNLLVFGKYWIKATLAGVAGAAASCTVRTS